jgi:23S rRNA (adenine2503-C2)-methyltransferase
MPLAVKYPLQDLKTAIAEVNRLQNVPLMIEYLMLENHNDSVNQAQELAAWVTNLNVHINLIPFNPIKDAPHLAGSAREVIENFSRTLKHAGLKVTTRHSLGADIAAACGQLVRKENRKRQQGT